MEKEQDAQENTTTQLREGTVVLAKGAVSAQVVMCPSCSNTLVIPPYTGALSSSVSCDGCGHTAACYCSDCSCSKDTHKSPYSESLTASSASSLANGTITQINGTSTTVTNGTLFVPATSPEPDRFQVLAEELVAEAGRRNSGKDETVLKQIVDLVKQLGIEVAPPVLPEPAEETVEESETIVIAEGSPVEEVVFNESGSMGESVSLREADAVFNPDKHEIIITPIRPGWGNVLDGYYYPEQSLREAVENGTFNGRMIKMYANHPPRKSDGGVPQDRSVWDWVSTMRETWWDEEKNRPQSKIKVYDDRFWTRATQAPDEIAFSILGGGKSRKGRVGNREARIVESLSQIRSVDWVTEAGAGGAIEKFAESAHEEFEMDLENLTAEQLKEGNLPLYEAIIAAAKAEAESAAASEPVTEAEAPVAEETSEVTTPEAEVVAEAPVAEATAKTPEAEEVAPAIDIAALASALEETQKQVAELTKQLSDKELAEAVAANKAATAEFVSGVIKESTLPAVAKNQVAEKFREATAGEGLLFATQDDLKVAIEKELAERQAIIDELVGKKSRVTGLGAVVSENPEASVRESVARRLEDKWGAAPTPAKTSVDGAIVADEDSAISESSQATYDAMAEKFGIK